MRWVGLAVALALATPAQAQSSAPATDPVAGVFATFRPEDPGCAIGIAQRDHAQVFHAVGAADLEHAAPITPQTVFEAGSVAKQFTAAAILLLATDGKLSLSDDIRKYLPEMPDYGRVITVDMLLSHTSGLRDWGEVADLAGWPRKSRVYTNAEVLQIAARQTALNYPPGEAYAYTNTGYNLAAIIIQRVTGQSLAEFTRGRMFGPLGMSHTSWRDDFRRIVRHRAIAYEAAGAAGWRQEMPFENTYGHGALLTTVGDLLIWNRALDEGRLGPGIAGQLVERARLSDGRRIGYARGVAVLSSDLGEELSHGGATAGYRAWLARFPGVGISAALLCNRTDVSPPQLGRRAVDALRTESAPPSPAGRPAPEADLAALPGVYVDERAGQVVRVVTEKRELRTADGGVLRPLAEAGRYVSGGVVFSFAGETLRRAGPNGEIGTFVRKASARPAEGDLTALAGAYSSLEAGGGLVASVRDGALVIAPADRPSAAFVAPPLYKDAFYGDGKLVRVVRDARGRVTALRLSSTRVYALDFQRVR